jgi:hypothetical protein
VEENKSVTRYQERLDDFALVDQFVLECESKLDILSLLVGVIDRLHRYFL